MEFATTVDVDTQVQIFFLRKTLAELATNRRNQNWTMELTIESCHRLSLSQGYFIPSRDGFEPTFFKLEPN